MRTIVRFFCAMKRDSCVPFFGLGKIVQGAEGDMRVRGGTSGKTMDGFLSVTLTTP